MDANDKWHTSIDPASESGVCLWLNGRPELIGAVRAAKKKDVAKGQDHAGMMVVDAVVSNGEKLMKRTVVSLHRPHTLWPRDLLGFHGVVVEESMGPSQKTVAQLGERRGYLRALCEVSGVPFVQVNTSIWRKALGEHFGLIWPGQSELAKALAVRLVRERWDIECTHDEAEAVLIGMWAFLTRTWDGAMAEGVMR